MLLFRTSSSPPIPTTNARGASADPRCATRVAVAASGACGVPSPAARDNSTTRRIADGGLSLSLLLFLLSFSTSSLPPPLLFSGSPLGKLLLLYCFGLDFNQVIACAAPVGIQDESLIVFGLRKNASPCVEEGGCVRYGTTDSLRRIGQLESCHRSVRHSSRHSCCPWPCLEWR